MNLHQIGSLEQIACRRPATNPDWWTADADPQQQTVAATLCMSCPALTPCNTYRQALGPDAAGTYAAVYLPLADQETDTEFDAIVNAMGWTSNIPAGTLTIRDTGWTQLALWGPNTDARMLHTPPRRRRPRPGRGVPGGAGSTDCAVTAGA